MKKFISTMLISAILVGCGSGGSGGGGGGSSAPLACNITSLNGVDAPANTIHPLLVDAHGNFIGDALILDANCSGSSIKKLTWEIVERPSSAYDVELFRTGSVAGNVSENWLYFWNDVKNVPSGDYVDRLDGRYVVEVYATDRDGRDSNVSRITVEYLYAHYVSGEYVDGNALTDLEMMDTDRPYFVNLPTKAKSITIGGGVEVYSNKCNGDERSGFGCELEAEDAIIVGDASGDTTNIYGGVFRAAETRSTTFKADNTNFTQGSINHHNSNSPRSQAFSSVIIDNCHFNYHKGVVLTGADDKIKYSSFTDTMHEFNSNGISASISIDKADSALIQYNVFNDVGIAVGVSTDTPSANVNSFYNNTTVLSTEESVYDSNDDGSIVATILM